MYKSSEIAQNLGTSERTLRRWSEQLENREIVFHRDSSGRREYSDEHIELLRRIKVSLAERGTTLEQAISRSLEMVPGNAATTVKVSNRSLETLIPSFTEEPQSHCITQDEYDAKRQQLQSVWGQMTTLIGGDWMRIVLFQYPPTTAQQLIAGKWSECLKQMEIIMEVPTMVK